MNLEELTREQLIAELQRARDEIGLLRHARDDIYRLFDQLPAAVNVRRGPDHVFTYANPRFLSFVPGREILGKPFRDAMPDMACQGLLPVLDRVYATAEPFRLDDYLIRGVGNEPGIDTYNTITFQPTFGADGCVTGVLTHSVDVTEQVILRQELASAAEELKRQTVRLDLILRSAGDGIFGLDAQGRVSFVNPVAARMLGYEPLELIGQEMHGLVHARRSDGSAYPAEECPIVRALREGSQHEGIEEEFWTKGGRSLLVEVGCAPKLIDGEVAGAVVVFRDVTDRRHAELFRRILHEVTSVAAGTETVDEIMPRILEEIGHSLGYAVAGFWGYRDQDDALHYESAWHRNHPGAEDFVECSRALARLPHQGLVGRVWHSGEALGSSDIVSEPCFLRAEAAAHAGLHGALLFPIRSGDRTLGVIELLRFEKREPDDWLVTMMEAIGGQIGQLIERRMAEAAAIRCAVTIEELRRIDALKDAFLGAVSHELRTPLSVILGSGLLLKNGVLGALSEKQGRYLEKVIRNAEKLAGLVDNLLEMSRIQSGRFTLTPRPLRIGTAIDRALAQIQPLAEEQGLSLIAELPADVPEVLADEERLVQILCNLLKNAVAFTPEGGTVCLRARLDAGRLRCEIEDTGIGIAEADLDRLFQPFFQVQQGDARSVSGAGLGLPISKALIEAHGGVLGARSAVGRGSCFWFSLPMAAG